jgi:hypothetical protein
MFILFLSFIKPSSLYLTTLLIVAFLLVFFVLNDCSYKFYMFKTFVSYFIMSGVLFLGSLTILVLIAC